MIMGEASEKGIDSNAARLQNSLVEVYNAKNAIICFKVGDYVNY